MGFPHDEQFLAAADSTWGDRNLWGILLMMFGGSVLEETRKFTDVDKDEVTLGICDGEDDK